MIFEIHKKGSGFRGLMRYMLDPKKENPRILGGTMTGQSIDALCHDAARYRRKRPRLKKAVFHASLRPAPGEDLSQEQMANMAMEVMDEIGFARAPYIICAHDDHIHIAAIRIDADGDTVSDSNDYKKASKVMQKIEKRIGLKPVAMTPEEASKKAKRGAPDWQIHRHKRTGERPGAQRLQKLIDNVLSQGQVSLEMFGERLESVGVGVRPYYRKGVLSGMGFAHDGVKYKASQLGADYKIAGLRRRGLADNMTQDQVMDKALGGGGYFDGCVKPAPPVNTPKSTQKYDPNWRERTKVQRQYYILYRRNIAAGDIQDWRLWENQNGRFLINTHNDYHVWDKGDQLILRKADDEDLTVAVGMMLRIAEDKGWNLAERAERATGTKEFLAEIRRQVEERLAAKDEIDTNTKKRRMR